MTKRESSLEMRAVILIGGGLVQEIGGVYIKGCSEDFCIFSFPSILDTLFL